MVKCSFCGKEEKEFKGIHLIKNDGSIDFFCSSKCRKNALKLKRDKRKLKWTRAYRETLDRTRAKEKVVDTRVKKKLDVKDKDKKESEAKNADKK